jgi:hypothetical protein
MGRLRLWWRQADHYDRLSAHLQARGMATVTRAIIAVIAAALSVDALGTIWTPTLPHDVVPLACTLTALVSAAVGALVVRRWPTRAAATALAVLSTSSIALIALAQHIDYLLLLLLNAAVPFGIQVVVHMLSTDAERAERDQLTGLLTRRAFRRRAKARLEQGVTSWPTLSSR